MKIILRADVENLGRLGDVVTVKAGYGRNYLLPQGLAMLVTPGNLKAFELERKKLQARMAPCAPPPTTSPASWKASFFRSSCAWATMTSSTAP